MMRQTLALFLDAYRELNAKKLFWITMGLSVLVVVAVAALGINDKGITFFWWTIENPVANAKRMTPPVFYRFVYANFAIPLWLTWGATILALISTSSIIPDFVSGGAIELALSKPIARTRLILTKYLTALTFVTLQVLVFSAACFFVFGIRARSWDPSLFLAVPIIVLFFSYLYAMCALIGLITRSTIAAVLLTVVFWIVIFGAHTTENMFLFFKLGNEMKQERIAAHIETLLAQRRQSEDQAKAENREVDAAVIHVNDTAMEKRQKQLESARKDSTWLVRGHAISYAVMTILPKTKETVGLLDRYLLTAKERDQFREDDNQPAFALNEEDVRISEKQMARRLEQELRGRDVVWIVGTSVAFEVAVVGLMVYLFRRRDF
jgi:ABC-type transport system involved in multi-copper enzyme maturation permease subunit